MCLLSEYNIVPILDIDTWMGHMIVFKEEHRPRVINWGKPHTNSCSESITMQLVVCGFPHLMTPCLSCSLKTLMWGAQYQLSTTLGHEPVSSGQNMLDLGVFNSKATISYYHIMYILDWKFQVTFVFHYPLNKGNISVSLFWVCL